MPEEKTKEILELQVPSTLKGLVEALVFAAKEPLTIKQMKDIYEGEGPQSYLRQLDADEVEAAVNELNAEYETSEKPYRIVRIAGGFQFATLSSYADWIGRLYKEQARRKLSQSGIESLAIIAYKQPVTKADIESIRGVNCDYVLKTLLEKELVTIVGRAHAPGRPLLYGTTREFLKHFGLNEITDLPRPREIEEILGESQFETERRMLEAQAGADKMKEEEPEFKSRLPHIPKKKSELDGSVEIKSKDGLREIKTVVSTELPISDQKEILPNPIKQTSSHEETSTGHDAQPALETQEDSNIVLPTVELSADPPAGNQLAGKDEVVLNQNEAVFDSPEKQVVEDMPYLGAREDEKVSVGLTVGEENPTSYQDQELPVTEVSQGQTNNLVNSHQAVNKSKWQSWKEKVQGFIKKIFG
jgi:segregation and condensation protein B